MASHDTSQARVRIQHLQQMKKRHEAITMLTCYDAMTARIFDTAGIDMLLVGDSYANTMLGYDSTIPASLEQMCVVTQAVARGATRAFIVADLPFGSYEASHEQAITSAVALIKAGASAVKLEGGIRQAETIRAITQAGILVVGHVGYTPQSTEALGGPRVQGRGSHDAQVIEDAVAAAEAGASLIVLEMVPSEVAEKITQIVPVPTIGIGAGPSTDGQVLVWTDMAGMQDWAPKFVKIFAHIGEQLQKAAEEYASEVKARRFPGPEHTFHE